MKAAEIAPGVVEDAEQAAGEVLSGEPHRAGRRWLAVVSLVGLVLFITDSLLVLSSGSPAWFDIPVAHFVQSFSWGPLTYPMDWINQTAGLLQVAVGVVVVMAMFIFERRAGFLMALGSIGSLLDALLKTSIGRHRPTPDLVNILSPTTGYSYPSGHAVFFTWLAFMAAAAFAPRLHRTGQIIIWSAAAVVIVLTCLARVWAGAHWPSDVAGGLLLGITWSAFVLWVPERWLPSPSWRTIRGRRQASSQR